MMSLLREPIAIIGSGCRFPGGSNTPSRLWDLLKNPRDVRMDIPEDRFDARSFYHPDGSHPGTMNVHKSYFLSEDIRQFDTQFFNIQANDAESIDPQQRVLLEVVYEALEASRIKIEQLQGSDTAVYVGLMSTDWMHIMHRDLNFLPTYAATGVASSIISNRVSYFFDWHGPSMTIDTACSSSLVAVHHAVQALRSGTSRVAVAAGANLILGPEPYIAESNLNMLSPDGLCRMWDASVDGYGRGEGVAAIVMKPLRNALEDGDEIVCLVRETGINQDGRTQGITMPSQIAQTALIRDTYARAGLDIRNALDRCQYFEAHGTGTPAGDPKEAEAIRNAFFDDEGDGFENGGNKLYVGSVKTVIGHTEGTAGLAGILKASLALQNKEIPPNMHFNSLNPAVKPFYKNLEVPVARTPWPTVAAGQPRRASVNSFGFGGTNAHAILESWDAPAPAETAQCTSRTVWIPFVFSASSEKAVIQNMVAYSDYLKQNPSVNLSDLAYSLYYHKSTLAYRSTISADTAESLRSQLDEKITAATASSPKPVGVRGSENPSPRVLGVFTGQGAQWEGMGRQLIRSSATISRRFAVLEDALLALPPSDRPTWSIRGELCASLSSRLGEAALSQPLCTAVQIVLVDLLRSTGVNFSSIVGHSSGEIAGAYAAGLITAENAIQIAYYRGVHSRKASGINGTKGAMMAVGASQQNAEELCELLDDRISVAAINAPNSITLSGDEDAIHEAAEILKEENAFARVLKVDTAYHSSHMLRCSDDYLKSLQTLDIQVRSNAGNTCKWFSSTYRESIVTGTDALKATYWRDNMVKPVLFSQAVESAFKAGSYDIVVEIGPHSALKGPFLEIVQSLTEAPSDLPYTSLLTRGKDDIAAISSALGLLWLQLGCNAVNLRNYETFCSPELQHKALGGLPLYSWDHDRRLWGESRTARAVRTLAGPLHVLLGQRDVLATPAELRWRNVLRPKDLPWLSGHALQGQVVFPGAGYAVMAVEAAKLFAAEKSPNQAIKLLEVMDVAISRAIAFNDDSHGVEIVVTLDELASVGNYLTAKFTCYASPSKETDGLTISASGIIRVTLGDPSPDTLPTRSLELADMAELDEALYYDAMDSLGYGWTGPFKALYNMRRRLDAATGFVQNPSEKVSPDRQTLHPALVDAAIQSLFAAYHAPGDSRLWCLQVPTHIRHITVNPLLCDKSVIGERVIVDAVVTDTESVGVTGDLGMYPENGKNAILQVEGITTVPLTNPTPADDRCFFSEAIWTVVEPDAEAVAANQHIPERDAEKTALAERVAYYYLRVLGESWTPERRVGIEKHHKAFLDFADYSHYLVSEGKHPYGRAEWTHDTHEEIIAMINRYPEDDINFALIQAMGENMESVIEGKTAVLQHMTNNDMLDNIYSRGHGCIATNDQLASIIQQISYLHPHMRMLEIGAGTGGSTKSILAKLDGAFETYTFTDISAGFFEKARTVFKDYEQKLVFKTLDIEKAVTEQGFVEHSYNLVVAAHVLHATESLERTMTNVRRLLKPNGYFILLEITEMDLMSYGLMFGGLSGWWVGIDDGRRFAPTVSTVQWDAILRRTGFSGVDSTTAHAGNLPYPFSISISRAVTDQVLQLRNPLAAALPSFDKELIILGGITTSIASFGAEMLEILKPYYQRMTVVKSMADVAGRLTSTLPTVLCLTDLDRPLFRDMASQQWDGLKLLFERAGNILWLTKGSRADEPFHNMSVGLYRSVSHEMSHLEVQFLDIEPGTSLDKKLVAETLLRLDLVNAWGADFAGKAVWSTEPELVLEGQKLKTMRLIPQKEQNDRYNSPRRLITVDSSPRTSSIAINQRGESFALEETSHLLSEIDLSTVDVCVTHSVLHPINISSARSDFLSYGSIIGSNEKVLVLSTGRVSKITVPKTSTISCEISTGLESQYLAICAASLEAQSIASAAASCMQGGNGSLLVHGARPLLEQALVYQTTKHGPSTMFVNPSSGVVGGCLRSISVHKNHTTRVIRSRIPQDVEMFIDLAIEQEEATLGKYIASLLPRSCIRKRGDILGGEGSVFCQNNPDHIANILGRANAYAKDACSKVLSTNPAKTLPLAEVWAHDGSSDGKEVVVSWDSDSVPVKVKTASSAIQFKADKTYLLVGLSGDLGRALSTWMVDHGARYIVLTSRSPQPAPEWQRAMESQGATVMILPADVADLSSLRSLHDKIGKTLPPIAGVANGAMVLRDTLFSNMDFDMLNDVLRPKVDGTIYLDQIFSADTLDFFILLSSLTCVMGNTGQANYSAANMFMLSMAAQRRKRGLAGSVMNISAVIGLGYLKKASEATLEQLTKTGGFLPISVVDFQELFAEAVLAGHPSSGRNLEITSGVRYANSPDIPRVVWFDNPKFAHFIRFEKGENNKTMKKSSLALKEPLMAAKKTEDVHRLIQEAFLVKLEVSLGISPEEVDAEKMPLSELGVDSLVAVELRSWFLKEIMVDMPVLKLLGSTSIANIVSDAVTRVPSTLIPNLILAN